MNAPELLPAAFYELSRYSYTELYGPSPHGAISDDIQTLSSFDMQCLSLGKEASQQAITTLIQNMGNSNSPRDQGWGASYDPSRHFRNRSTGYTCISAAACRDDLAELVQLATQHYLFERGKGYTDPLYVAEELGQLKSAEVSDCKACARSLEQWAARERERMWKLIPQWFHLTSEDNARRSAMYTEMNQEKLRSRKPSHWEDTSAVQLLLAKQMKQESPGSSRQ